MTPEERKTAMAEVLCRGTGDRQCINYDRDVTGGCSWCDRDAATLAPLVEQWIREAQVPAVFVADDHEECEQQIHKARRDGAAAVVARVELAQARANRCAHGVNRSRAACRVCDQPTNEPAVAGEETSDE